MAGSDSGRWATLRMELLTAGLALSMGLLGTQHIRVGHHAHSGWDGVVANLHALSVGSRGRQASPSMTEHPRGGAFEVTVP